MRNACRIFVWKPEGKRLLIIRKREWGNNIKNNLKEGYEDLDRTNQAHNNDGWQGLTSTVMNLWVQKSVRILTI